MEILQLTLHPPGAASMRRKSRLLLDRDGAPRERRMSVYYVIAFENDSKTESVSCQRQNRRQMIFSPLLLSIPDIEIGLKSQRYRLVGLRRYKCLRLLV